MLQGDHGAWRRVLRLFQGGDPEETHFWFLVAGDQKRPGFAGDYDGFSMGLLGIMMGLPGLPVGFYWDWETVFNQLK